MPSTKLTKQVVEAAEPQSKTYALRDIDLRGFVAMVQPTGRKSWAVEYRPVDGGRRADTRRLKIGDCNLMGEREARKEAKRLLASVRLGADPARERQEQRDTKTFDEVADQFKKDVCEPPRLRPNTARLYKMNLKAASPYLGKLKVTDITKSDVQKMHRKIGNTRPTMANNALVTISSLYRFAADEGYVDEGTNPARAIKKFKTEAKERFLSPAEFGRLGDAIREFETTGLAWQLRDLEDESKAKHRPKKAENTIVVLPPDVAAALRLLVFTGSRKMEVLGLKWSEVDIDRGLLNLANSKTGRRVVILNAPALEVLNGLPRVGSFVFPGADPTKHRGDITNYWYRARKRAGLDGSDGNEPVRLHDLRHSFASFGVSGGMSLPVVGRLLGHVNSSTTARYSHLADDPLRQASERIGKGIAAAMGGPGTSAGEVDALPTTRSGQ